MQTQLTRIVIAASAVIILSGCLSGARAQAATPTVSTNLNVHCTLAPDLMRETYTRKVSVIGAVHTQGQYLITNSTRVLDAIAAAGGLSVKPNSVEAILISADGTEKSLNIVDLMSSSSSSDNVVLQPGDIICISTNNVKSTRNVKPASPAQILLQPVPLFGLLKRR